MGLPSVLNQGKVKSSPRVIETDFGVLVTYNWNLLTVQVPRVFSGSLYGLCGNFNADPEVYLTDDGDIYGCEALEN